MYIYLHICTLEYIHIHILKHDGTKEWSRMHTFMHTHSPPLRPL